MPGATWSTSSDWDNAVSQSGVVHASVGDYTGDGTVQIGTVGGQTSPTSLWLFHEDSGSTATDSAGSNDGTVSGVTQGVTGLWNTTAYEFTPSNSPYVELGNVLDSIPSTGWSLSAYVRPDSVSRTQDIFGKVQDSQLNNYLVGRIKSDGSWRFFQQISDNPYDVSGGTAQTGVWQFVTIAAESDGTMHLYADGSEIGSLSAPSQNNGTYYGLRVGEWQDLGRHFDGAISTVMYHDRALSASEHSALSDALSGGTLETATKSISPADTPRLKNLSYALNGESITVTVTGSPGTQSEESVSQVLDGASAYDLSWSSEHSSFKATIDLSTADASVSPTLSAFTVESDAPVAPSGLSASYQ